jgi:hypothetical protein
LGLLGARAFALQGSSGGTCWAFGHSPGGFVGWDLLGARASLPVKASTIRPGGLIGEYR